MRTTRDGRGAINVLAADKLMMNPRLYSTFLLWLLSELFEVLPEIGDPDKPKLVFFFDEAHLLFDEAPKVLVDRVEQVVRLIRSKGVGVYFVTQNPLDVPDTVLAQLGNRIQHALRAYTPREQKAVKTAADTFRPNPDFDCMTAITQLGVGEALVSPLEAKAVPAMVQRTLIRPPASRMGPITPEERRKLMSESPVAGQYDETIDRELAFELLKKRADDAQKAEEQAQGRDEQEETGRSRWTIPGFRRRRARADKSTAVAVDFAHTQRAAHLEPSDSDRGGDQVGCPLGRLVGRPGHRARHSGQPQEGVLTLPEAVVSGSDRAVGLRDREA